MIYIVEKMAFAYAHGGPVLDSASHDGLNERGRNLVRSVKSAVASGADKIFIGESVYPGYQSQIELLIQRGFFSGIEHVIDFHAYPISQNVKFPKNYLMNRCAQRAHGYFGIIFSDSDVLFSPGFPQRAAQNLQHCDFLQPEYIMYTNPDGSDQGYLESTMKRAHVVEDVFKNNISYLEGMPGMVNVAKRDSFLEIGGFSQAVSGVNYEDIEYQIRLKLLNKKTSFMHDEWVRHLYHSRSAITRQAENLPNMFYENSNFMNWWVDHYIQIRGTAYNRQNFEVYLRRIIDSFEANYRLTGPYTNETGTIIHEFVHSARYQGYSFGAAEPYVESGTTDEKITAIMNASRFWGLSYEEIIRLNAYKFQNITPEIVRQKEHMTDETQENMEIERFFDELLNDDRNIETVFEQLLDEESDDVVEAFFDELL